MSSLKLAADAETGYGAARLQQRPAPARHAGELKTMARRRMNVLGMLAGLLLPWLLFTVLAGVLATPIHSQQPYLCYMVAGISLVAIFVVGCIADEERRKTLPSEDEVSVEPSWYLFLFFSLLAAWILAVAIGGISCYFGVTFLRDNGYGLNTYAQVDPIRAKGNQLADAAKIEFLSDARLDASRSMGFRNNDMYCVAPITLGDLTLPKYDFWAVGKNCCSGQSSDFHCGAFNSPLAHTGLRMLSAADRPYYRLAVQQAEATYRIKAVHPLFFEWVQDFPDDRSASLKFRYDHMMARDIGLASFAYFVIQAFVTLSATLFYSKHA